MEALLLMLVIIMFAVLITYSGEIYLYLSLTLGSLMADIQDKIKSIVGRKK